MEIEQNNTQIVGENEYCPKIYFSELALLVILSKQKSLEIIDLAISIHFYWKVTYKKEI